MRDWLTIELVLAILLVTSFTCVGLLSLWAATSPRHWFVRTAVVLVVLSPLLMIPAYEPFVVFIIQSLIIAMGMLLYRWQARQHSPERSGSDDTDAQEAKHFRFSISTLLLMTVFVAIVVAIAMKLPKLNLTAWTTVGLNGAVGGAATLFAASMFAHKRGRTALRVICLACCIAMSVVVSMFDWFMPSITDSYSGWPPDPTSIAMLGMPGPVRPIVAWLFIPLLVALLTTLLVALWRAAFGASRPPSGKLNPACPRAPRRRLARGVFILLALAIGAFPLLVLGKLLTPDPIPETTMPAPNAYDDFLSAANIVASTQLDGSLDLEVAMPKQISAEVAKCAKAYELIDDALDKPCVVPVDYSFSTGDLPMDHLMSLRAVARALNGKGKLAELEGRNDDAAECYQDAIQFGYAIRRGGLLVDALVGMVCAGFGTSELYRTRDKLSPDEFDRCIALFSKIDAADEPYDDVWYRDRVWSQRAYGWYGHLQQFLTDVADHRYEFFFISSDQYSLTYWTNQATLRLLICELALAQFHQDKGRWPESLNELVPKYVSKVPVDPLDPNALPLKYHRSDSSCVLYSVGPNRVDDGGAAPSADDLQRLPQTGDLRLDLYFKPEATTNSGSAVGDGLESGESKPATAETPGQE